MNLKTNPQNENKIIVKILPHTLLSSILTKEWDTKKRTPKRMLKETYIHRGGLSALALGGSWGSFQDPLGGTHSPAQPFHSYKPAELGWEVGLPGSRLRALPRMLALSEFRSFLCAFEVSIYRSTPWGACPPDDTSVPSQYEHTDQGQSSDP